MFIIVLLLYFGCKGRKRSTKKFYMLLSLTAKKVTERNSCSGTAFVKQFYGSAQSSELGTFGGKCTHERKKYKI